MLMCRLRCAAIIDVQQHYVPNGGNRLKHIHSYSNYDYEIKLNAFICDLGAVPRAGARAAGAALDAPRSPGGGLHAPNSPGRATRPQPHQQAPLHGELPALSGRRAWLPLR